MVNVILEVSPRQFWDMRLTIAGAEAAGDPFPADAGLKAIGHYEEAARRFGPGDDCEVKVVADREPRGFVVVEEEPAENRRVAWDDGHVYWDEGGPDQQVTATFQGGKLVTITEEKG